MAEQWADFKNFSSIPPNRLSAVSRVAHQLLGSKPSQELQPFFTSPSQLIDILSIDKRDKILETLLGKRSSDRRNHMKKLIVIGILVGVLVLVLGLTSLAFAQSPTPEPGQYPGFGSGMMDGYGGGMMGGRGSGWREGSGYGPMHEYMEQAFAGALGLTEEEIEQRLEAGETMWQIAEDLGYSQEEFGELMVTARTKALNQAVETGVLTREQAEWMIARMAQRQVAGYGPGSGGCMGGGHMGGARGGFGGRWNP
jgi:Spy/CpxP family protein refolding chaperone